MLRSLAVIRALAVVAAPILLRSARRAVAPERQSQSAELLRQAMRGR